MGYRQSESAVTQPCSADAMRSTREIVTWITCLVIAAGLLGAVYLVNSDLTADVPPAANPAESAVPPAAERTQDAPPAERPADNILPPAAKPAESAVPPAAERAQD